MSWAIAVGIDLICVMAARERQRNMRLATIVRRVSWPAVVLAGGILRSLAANLADAQPPPGPHHCRDPPGACPTAVSMLERRAATRRAISRPEPARPQPARRPPGGDGGPNGPSWPVRPSGASPDPPLLGLARRAAASHHDTHGHPITRDALRSRLGISTQHVSDLLRPPEENQHD